VDPWFLVEAAPDLTSLVRTARQVNDGQPEFVVELVRRAAGRLEGLRVAALGLAYKPDVDDLRESPAIEIARLLSEKGAQVIAYEPYKAGVQLTGIQCGATLQDTLESADAALLLVAHAPLKNIQPKEAAAWMRGRLAIDTVNGWPALPWQAAGFRLFRLGAGY
jgi:UDP-N-acetyl-D-mannosaminuronic acid dehydrogenase